MTSEIQTRKVKSEDAQFLCSLMNDEAVIAVLNEVPTTVETWTGAIAEWEQDADEENYIIFCGSAPVGLLGVNGLLSEGKRVYIKIIALVPAYQERGIGQHVIHQLIDSLTRKGYVSLGLYTDQSNVRAQRCYAKCGFEITEKTVQKMSNGSMVGRYRMERMLG